MQEAHARLASPAVPASTLELWRPNAAMWAMFCGQPAGDALELLRPALEDDALGGEPDSLLNTVAIFTLIHGDELETPRRDATAIIDLARRRGWMIALAHGSFLRSMALMRAGRVRDAEADARLSFEFKRRRSPLPALLWSLYPLVDALVELDELAERRRRAGDGGPRRPAGGHGRRTAVAAEPRAPAARPAPTRRRPRRSRRRRRLWEEFGVLHPGLASWRVDAAEALVALGDPAGARRHAEEHLALAERLGLPGPLGAGLRALARTADRDERMALLEQAVALLAACPAQLEHARALVDLGAALRRANRRADARGPLRQALDLAERGGMRLLADRARDELQAAGARPRRAALTGPQALTPAEHRVAHSRRRRPLATARSPSSSTSPGAPSRRT